MRSLLKRADIEKVHEAVGGGGGRSDLLHSIRKPMIEGTLHDDFNLRQHGKDMLYAMRAAERAGIHLPVGQSVQHFFQHCVEQGFDAIWSGEMWAVWQKNKPAGFSLDHRMGKATDFLSIAYLNSHTPLNGSLES